MIRVLSRKEIDNDLWNSCIDKSSNGQIFGYSWYLDACCPGWKGMVKNNYEAVFPFSSKNKFGINYLYQPFFTRHFGVYSSIEISENDKIKFLECIPDKYRYWQFCLNSIHQNVPTKIDKEKRVYQELNLNQDYLTIRNRYHENLLRNLKKAEKANLTIIKSYNPESVVSQFKFHQKEKQLGFVENDFETLHKLTKTLSEQGKSICWAVSKASGEELAGAFFMVSNNRIVYLKGFSSEEGKKCGAMHFLFDILIQELANTNLVLDFGGSNVDTVSRFYKSFGAMDCIYLQLKLNRLPSILKWLKR